MPLIVLTLQSSAQPVGLHPACEYRPYPEAHQQLGMPPTFYDGQGQSHPGYTSSKAYDAGDVNPVAPALGASHFHPPIGDNLNLYAGGTSIPMPTPIPRLPIQSPGKFYPAPSYTPSTSAPHYPPPPFQVAAISPQPPAHPTGTFPREGEPVASSSRSRGRSKRKIVEVESDDMEERKAKMARKGRETGETYLSAWRMIMEGKAVASLGLRAIRPRVEGQEAAADALRQNNYVSRENIYENDNLVDVSFPNNSQVPHGGPSTAPLADRREANKMAGGATKKKRGLTGASHAGQAIDGRRTSGDTSRQRWRTNPHLSSAICATSLILARTRSLPISVGCMGFHQQQQPARNRRQEGPVLSGEGCEGLREPSMKESGGNGPIPYLLFFIFFSLCN
ncbi:hypothetical protein EW146_g4619 [Bondarzewia mesenterica]|uniref:Uncharacterized protein n=1 Tax=Bondarzewia mesenterica TaxID=1095465 RepID=A0A4S4LV35_9AGAM|nr:hypothetical protein EW146_g4619 [Bondarzewia mesenterica]